MQRRTAIVLPGLDGTGNLLEDFCAGAPPEIDCRAIRYPTDEPLGYDALERYVLEQLPTDRPLIVIGESFSGPIAVRLAARLSQVTALVLCNSFITPPRSPLLRFGAHAPLFRVRLPERILAALMLAPLATPALTSALATTLRRVEPSVLAYRIRELLRVDETPALKRVRVPITYLRGTRDRLVPDRALHVITATAPAVRVVRIEAPHAILQTAPRESWTAIESVFDLPT